MADVGEGPRVAGWEWGWNDGLLRWGTNTVERVMDGPDVGLYGPLVTFDFDGDAGDDEGTISLGDSGGPLWVRRAGEWQLAAIHFATDSEFRREAEGPTLQGAIFDFRGLFRQTGAETWEVEPIDGGGPVSAESFSTRVWPRRQWIDSVVQRAPGPASLLVAPNLGGPYVAATNVNHDPVLREFRISMSGSLAFFRVTGAAGPVLRDIRLEGTRLVIRYD
jgi:hypothetical protein